MSRTAQPGDRRLVDGGLRHNVHGLPPQQRFRGCRFDHRDPRFPAPGRGEPEQNYEVPPRSALIPAVWQKYDPRDLVARLRGTALFMAYADQAAERQMNGMFLADARSAGFMVETLVLHGGHTFPMVEQGLPPAFSFMERALGATPPKP